MDTIGGRIKHLRDKSGYSMGKLEKILGFAGGSFDKWEKDKSVPGGKALIELSKFFSVSVDWILIGENRQQTAEFIPPEGLELLAKFYQLTERQQGIIEGRIEEMLLGRKDDDSTKEAYPSKIIGRGEAVSEQGA